MGCSSTRTKYVVLSARLQQGNSVVNSSTTQKASCISHVRLVIVRGTIVIASQNLVNRHTRGQNLGKVRAGSCRCPGAYIFIFPKLNVFGSFVSGLPHSPACGVDHIRHVGVLEDNTGKVAPRTAQVIRASFDVVIGGSVDGTVVLYGVSVLYTRRTFKEDMEGKGTAYEHYGCCEGPRLGARSTTCHKTRTGHQERKIL